MSASERFGHDMPLAPVAEDEVFDAIDTLERKGAERHDTVRALDVLATAVLCNGAFKHTISGGNTKRGYARDIRHVATFLEHGPAAMRWLITQHRKALRELAEMKEKASVAA